MKIVNFLIVVNRYLSWFMLVLFIVTLISGYSMTAKGSLVTRLTFGLINTRNGYYIHRKTTYFLSILISLHTSVNLRFNLYKMGVKDPRVLGMISLFLLIVMVTLFTIIEFLY